MDICQHIELDALIAAKQQPIQQFNAGIFTASSINDVISRAIQRPDPRQLYDCFWYEGELSCLFADSNLGKSILAVQIAREIAQRYNEQVLYFDFELSDKQFQMRYTSDNGKVAHFPTGLLRVEVDHECVAAGGGNFILPNLEQVIIASGIRILIIDNLTWLCTATENGEDAAVLMQQLMSLKFKYDLSLLVIAHTPKRDMTRPITANDLAGSKKLFNFFDSVFAIGRSAQDEHLRYIKQLKCRYGAFTHDSSNVLTCSIERDEDAFLQFKSQGQCSESVHLKTLTDKDRENLDETILTMHREGRTYRQIAAALNVSMWKITRVLDGNK